MHNTNYKNHSRKYITKGPPKIQYYSKNNNIKQSINNGIIGLPSDCVMIRTSDKKDYIYIKEEKIRKFIGEHFNIHFDEKRILDLPIIGKHSLVTLKNFFEHGKICKSSSVTIDPNIIKIIKHIKSDYDNQLFTIMAFLGIDLNIINKNVSRYKELYNMINVSYDTIIRDLFELDLLEEIWGHSYIGYFHKLSPENVKNELIFIIINKTLKLFGSISNHLLNNIHNKKTLNEYNKWTKIKYIFDNITINSNIDKLFNILKKFNNNDITNFIKSCITCFTCEASKRDINDDLKYDCHCKTQNLSVPLEYQ